MTTSRLAPHLGSRLGAGIAAVALGAALMITTPVAATAAPQTAGLQYVALGDSYAAGFGITPSTGVPVPGCEQAEQNYPHQVAAALGLVLNDVTCTGAVTANIIGTPQVTASYFSGGGTAQPQSLALSADTDVVTVSIGGNDAGFSSIAETCLAETANGPVFGVAGNRLAYDTCEEAYQQAGIDLDTQVSAVVAANLRAAYADIRAKAPNAKVFVVGYPSLLPDAANTPPGPEACFTPAFDSSGFLPNSVPFTPTDVPFIHSIEVLLNQTIAAEAATAGFTFIDNQADSLNHSVCPQSGEPYINGITIQSLTVQPYTVNGALHPNVAGVAYLAGRTIPVIAAAFPEPPAPPAPAPASNGTTPELARTGFDGAPVSLGIGVGMLLVGVAAVVLVRVRARRS